MKWLQARREPKQAKDEGSGLSNPVGGDNCDRLSFPALLVSQFRQQLEGVEEGRVWIEIVQGQLFVGQGVLDG